MSSPRRLNKYQRQVHAELIDAQREYGSNCDNKPHLFSGDKLPSPRQAKKMCGDCPLSGLKGPCRLVADLHVGFRYGVYDGEVFDDYKEVE